MALYEGERIKIFPETDVRQYERWIAMQGFTFKKSGDYLVIVKKVLAEFDEKRFAQMLVHRRKLKGISREEMANKVGVTEYTAWTWEIGRAMPNAYNLERIMTVLNLTERDLERCRI